MGGPGSKSISDVPLFIIPKDPELYRLFDQLGIERIEVTRELLDFDGSMVKEEAIIKAGLSPEFFRAFTSLTKVNEDPKNSTAARLLAPTTRKLGIESRSHSISEMRASQAYVSILKHLISNKSLTKSHESDLEKETQMQKVMDAIIDGDEATALKVALSLLGTDKDKTLARERINDLGANSCWLSPESMRVALFGFVNGDLQHKVGWVVFMGLHVGRETTEAIEFGCDYLPSMAELTNGLSFRPESMPANIQNVATSTVILKNGGGVGTGFIALYPKYVVTAYHVVRGAVERDGKKFIPLKITVGEEEILAEAEVVSVSGIGSHAKPDLAVLYVPDLPDGIKPLAFSDDSKIEDTEATGVNEGQQKKNKIILKIIDLLRENPEQFKMKPSPDEKRRLRRLLSQLEQEAENIIHYSKKVFVIGAPSQKPPYDLLVTEGKIDTLKVGVKQPNLVAITAPALPGNSGGPAVNEEGNVVGVVVQLQFEKEDSSRRRFGKVIKKGELTGGKMYAISTWGPSIREAIEKHRKSN